MYLVLLHSTDIKADSAYSYLIIYQVSCGIVGFYISNIQSYKTAVISDGRFGTILYPLILLTFASVLSLFSLTLATTALGVILTIISWRLSYEGKGYTGTFLTASVPLFSSLGYLLGVFSFQIGMFTACVLAIVIFSITNHFSLKIPIFFGLPEIKLS